MNTLVMRVSDMNISLTDYINDAVRILIILNAAKERKSLKVTEMKVKLYDYYLKFPYTMLGSAMGSYALEQNFDEYYAFFHWQPDVIKYRQSLNYLLAKRLIGKEFDESNNTIYQISDLGIEALSKIDNDYFRKLNALIATFLPIVMKISDSKIEEQIREKTNIFLRSYEVRNEN